MHDQEVSHGMDYGNPTDSHFLSLSLIKIQLHGTLFLRPWFSQPFRNQSLSKVCGVPSLDMGCNQRAGAWAQPKQKRSMANIRSKMLGTKHSSACMTCDSPSLVVCGGVPIASFFRNNKKPHRLAWGVTSCAGMKY